MIRVSPNGQKGLPDRTEQITVFSFIIVACPRPERRDAGVEKVRWHFPRVTANEQTADGSFRVAEDGASCHLKWRERWSSFQFEIHKRLKRCLHWRGCCRWEAVSSCNSLCDASMTGSTLISLLLNCWPHVADGTLPLHMRGSAHGGRAP